MLQSIAPVVRDAELGLKHVVLCTTEVSDCAIHVTSGHMSVPWIGETDASCKEDKCLLQEIERWFRLFPLTGSMC